MMVQQWLQYWLVVENSFPLLLTLSRTLLYLVELQVTIAVMPLLPLPARAMICYRQRVSSFQRLRYAIPREQMRMRQTQQHHKELQIHQACYLRPSFRPEQDNVIASTPGQVAQAQ